MDINKFYNASNDDISLRHPLNLDGRTIAIDGIILLSVPLNGDKYKDYAGAKQDTIRSVLRRAWANHPEKTAMNTTVKGKSTQRQIAALITAWNVDHVAAKAATIYPAESLIVKRAMASVRFAMTLRRLIFVESRFTLITLS